MYWAPRHGGGPFLRQRRQLMGPDALIWFGLGSLPFVGLQVAVLALIIAVPGLVDWFPRLAAAMTPKPQT